MTKVDLQKKSKSLPSAPGCYLMKDRVGGILYVGKAKNLKKRVTSYFTKDHSDSVKTKFLVEKIKDFEFVMTETEVEAYILENNLIKKHSPKYNFRLKDDKTYPYIQINLSEVSPRLEYTRKPKKSSNKVLVFGPFTIGSNVSDVMKTLTKSFELRDCTLREYNLRDQPCLLYQMKECSAPCVGKIEDQDYRENLDLVVEYLKGKPTKAFKYVQKRMQNFAESEEFEKAAILRDDLELLKSFIEDKNLQKNVEGISNIKSFQNVDIINYSFDNKTYNLDLGVYLVRNGLLIGHKNLYSLLSDLEDLSSSLKTLIFQYYQESASSLPDTVIFPNDKKLVKSEEESQLFQNAFQKLIDKSIQCKSDVKGFRGLLDLVRDQAREHQRVRISGQENTIDGLKKLAELLHLKEVPLNLECYDVAIWQGQAPTASQIVFNNGKLQKSKYRHYHLKELKEGNNDFAMMQEVFTRRIKKKELPDVFIVDGGKGQVSSVLKVLEEQNVSVPVVGIAKAKSKRESQATEERLIIPGRANEYVLKKNMNLFRIVVSMRDEAHRFSRRLHHKKMHDQLLGSWVFQVKGLSEKTKKKIMKVINAPLKEMVTMTRFEVEQHFKLNKRETTLLLKYFKNFQD